MENITDNSNNRRPASEPKSVGQIIKETWKPKIDENLLRRRMDLDRYMGRRMSVEQTRFDMEQAILNKPSSGLFVSKQADGWIEEARKRPNPRPLWKNLWFEEEVACLFADTNMGKSIYAVQIADAISRRGRRVMYFDFELSDKQFQLRYADEDSLERHSFPSTLIRSEFAQCNMPDSLEKIVECIEMEVVSHRCKIVIIDNITWICNRAESGDLAGELMQLLINMKRRWGLSILCLAHTPKRAMTASITQNSLAGSKRIANFMDSIFAIGIDRTNLPSGRYVKQIKVRSSDLRYGDDNVIRCEIEKVGGMLQLTEIGSGHERDMLIGTTDSDVGEDLREQIMELIGQGMSQTAVARQFSISQTKVSRIVRQARATMAEDEA